MKYRPLGKTGEMVSEIGLGCEHLQGKTEKEVRDVIDAALKGGINILDVFMSEPDVRTNIGKALENRRKQVLLQGHIGSVWQNGQYSRSRDLKACQNFFEDFLERLRTDYVDIGMIHYVDTEEDFDRIFNGDLIEYAKKLKESRTIRFIGMSSHNPSVAAKAVKTGLIDVLMFSINPAYDILPEDMDIDLLFEEKTYENDTYNGINPVRAELYRLCEAKGTAITVMKSLAAGSLLKAQSSPFGTALTPAQCIHYSLTRPAVASVLIGCAAPEEVALSLHYETASDAEKDYSTVLSGTPKYSLKGHCMYCNHCLPCPSLIDIAQVNKFLDLALMQDAPAESVREHYKLLNRHASDCVGCKSCEKNCPFSVPVTKRMEAAAKLFGF